MTQFVLQILDGDRAGEIVELDALPLSIGRRADNDLVLLDEKVSGKHAQILQEGENLVLRDLGSTNGTLMEGRAIEEVLLTDQDVIQLGRLHMLFTTRDAVPGRVAGGVAGAVASGVADAQYAEEALPEGSAAQDEDWQVRRVDQASLVASKAKTGLRSVIGLLLLLLLLLGAGSLYFFKGDASDGGRRSTARPPLPQPGNLLAAQVGDCEAAVGWQLKVSGSGFELQRPAHTGKRALAAVVDPSKHHALARSEVALPVSMGQKLLAVGHLRSSGGGRVALRLRFSSSQDADLVLTSGSVPLAYANYTRVELPLSVPSYCDQLHLEVLALLPNEEAEVWADDLGIFSHPEAPAPHQHKTESGQHFLGSGESLALQVGEDLSLLGIRPLVTEPALKELATAGLLCLSDAGQQLSLQPEAQGITLQVSGAGGSGAESAGLCLELPLDMVSDGLRLRKEGLGFADSAAKFAAHDGLELLCGQGNLRLLLSLPKAAALEGKIAKNIYRLEMPAATQCKLRTSFVQERNEAEIALRQAREQREQGQYGAALDQIALVLNKLPHHDDVVRRASKMRLEMQTQQGKRVEQLQADLESAAFFATRGAYLRLSQNLQALRAVYGEAHLNQPKLLQTMQANVTQALATMDMQEIKQQRQRLQELNDSLQESGEAALQELVQQYLQEYLKEAANGG